MILFPAWTTSATEFNFFRKAQIVAINEQVGEECAVVPLLG